MKHPKKEKTFVVIKHDSVQRSLVGEIIRRIERTGLKIIALKMTVPDKDTLIRFYNKDDTWFEPKGRRLMNALKNQGMTPDKTAIEYGKRILDTVIKYLMSGPVVLMAFEGNEAVGIVKKLVGSTEPLSSDVGTIRGDYTVDSYHLTDIDDRAIRNLVHCTDKPENAEREINIWFKPEEIMNYRLVAEEILYDVNLDGILE